MNYCNYKQGAGPRLARSGNRIVLKQMVSSLRTSMRGGSIISEGRRNVEAMILGSMFKIWKSLHIPL